MNTYEISPRFLLFFLNHFNRMNITLNMWDFNNKTWNTGGMWSVCMVSRWEHFCEIVRGSGLTFHNQHLPHLTCYVPFHCYFQHTPWPPSRAAGSWLTCSQGRHILEDSWEGGDSQQSCKDTKHLWQNHTVNSPLDKDERRWQTFQAFLAMPVDTLSVSKPHIIFACLGHFPPNTLKYLLGYLFCVCSHS